MTRVVSFACVCARVRVRARQEITWRCSRTHMTEPEPWQAAEINEGTVRTNFFKSNFTRPCLDVFPFYARVLPRTPRWNVLNETLFIYLFSGCRHWPTRTFWVHDDLVMKTWPESHFEKRLVLFLLFLNEWTGFAIMLQDSAGGFVLFCSFLFCFSPHLLLLPREILPSVQEDQGQ